MVYARMNDDYEEYEDEEKPEKYKPDPKAFFSNSSFYPTPTWLGRKLARKIKAGLKKVLEPSAGKGDLIEAISEDRPWKTSYYQPDYDISAIEIDPDLQATLRGKAIRLIDTDFLAFSGPDKFDLIIMNPPFKDGDKHLLKAIDILYRGQILCLLNAETIRNPYTNVRKMLVNKLDDIKADIEYIPGAFKDAERKTDVDIAIVDIFIDRKVEDDIFAGCDDKAEECSEEFKENYELATGKGVYELVAEYNQIIGICTETIVGYFKNYRKVGKYLALNHAPDEYDRNAGNLTAMMQGLVNSTVAMVRKIFWEKTLDLREVRDRMTSKKQAEFNHLVQSQCHMDFTENNIRNFILNLISGYEKTLTEAVLDIFDMLSCRHSWDGDNPNEKNVHYFNGWKTNKSWKVGKKVVIPIRGACGNYGGSAFWNPSLGWNLSYDAVKPLNDIDVVMNYFDGMNTYHPICTAIDVAFRGGYSSGIDSTYFKSTCHKKGTIHLTFKDEGILRRFNVCACKGKGWLPPNYGTTAYKELPLSDKAVVDSFEGENSYMENLNQPLFGAGVNPLQLAAPQPSDAEPGQLKLF